MATTLFDPSRGVDGYTTEYKSLLSLYTGSMIQNYSAGNNYKILAQRVLLAAQRWNRIPFTESSVLPQLSLPLHRYEHYVPGREYSPAELEQFFQHYRVGTVSELDDVHRLQEVYYPLDASFVELANWLRTQAPPSIIDYLCKLFNVRDSEELFTYYYQIATDMTIDQDINLELLLEQPEAFFSNDPPPSILKVTPPLPTSSIEATPFSYPRLPPSQEYLDLLERAREVGIDTEDKSTLDILLALNEPLPDEYQTFIRYLQSIKISPDDSTVAQAIQNTRARSEARRIALLKFPAFNLQRFAARHKIVSSDPVSRSYQIHDVVTALSFIAGAEPELEPEREIDEMKYEKEDEAILLDYDRIDPSSLKSYTADELIMWSRLLGLEPTDPDPIALANDLYFVLGLKIFFWVGDELAYGTNDEYEIYDYDNLLDEFTNYQDTFFGLPAIRRLRLLLDERPDTAELQEAIDGYLQKGLSQTSLLNFLHQVPDLAVRSGDRLTSYKGFILDMLSELGNLGDSLAGGSTEDRGSLLDNFYDLIQDVPATLADTILSLRIYDQGDAELPETITIVYNVLVDGGVVADVGELFQSTADHYLREFA